MGSRYVLEQYIIDPNLPSTLSHSQSWYVVVVQSLSCVWFFLSPWTAGYQVSLSFTVSQSLLEFLSIELVTLSNHFILCCPLLSQHPALFQRVSSLPQVAKVLNLQHQSIHEYSGLISFRIDWLDLLAFQGTLQEFSPAEFKAPILQRSAFCMVRLSHPYMTTGKTIALTRWTFVGQSDVFAF